MGVSRVTRAWRDWGLTITMLAIFAVILVGQSVSGWRVYNADQRDHARPPVAYVEYLGGSHFWEATTENWESEFLQMFGLVVLTIFLRQKGSPESDEPDEPPGAEKPPKDRRPPWPVRRGGAWKRLYEHSLSLALLTLFLVTFAGHVLSGAAEYSGEQLDHGRRPVSAAEFLSEPQLWFESLQNWQSEFLSSGLLVIMSVFLREKGSSQSKPVEEAWDSSGE